MSGSRALAISVLVIASACSRPNAVNNGAATDEGVAAIALPEEQYRDMLKRTTLATQSGSMYIAVLGLDEGCDELDAAVDKVIEKNLPQWRTNLIGAYRDNVPPNQLAEAVQRSPRRARSMLEPYRPAIGSAMKSASDPLLKSSAVEVLETMGDVALKVDRASIDMQARQRDLARMKASREMCGVKQWQRP